MDRLIWLSADEIIAIHQAVLRRYGGAAGTVKEIAFAQCLREHV